MKSRTSHEVLSIGPASISHQTPSARLLDLRVQFGRVAPALLHVSVQTTCRRCHVRRRKEKTLQQGQSRHLL
eukprot:6337291-Amphidinium_carterae.1